MHRLWLFSVRAYLKLGFFFYFKKIKVFNKENIPKNKPVLFLANHQNALLDPLLIGTNCDRFLFFLTRAGVFKKALISKIFASLQMLPVYRIRDGWKNLTNNTAIFETCSKLLSKGESVLIFPEGGHNLVRTVRPLSKGFTRIVFDTLEKYPNIDLQLVPVGLNFKNAINFPDSTSIFYGKSINAKDFFSGNRHEDVIKLKAKIQSELSKLTTHIPSENYDETLKTLSDMNVDFLNPQQVNDCIKSSFQNCHNKPKSKIEGLRGFFKILLIINLFVPYFLWKFIIQPKIKEIEFMSTFRFAVAVTLVPVWILLLVFLCAFSFGWGAAVAYLIVILVIVLLTVKT